MLGFCAPGPQFVLAKLSMANYHMPLSYINLIEYECVTEYVKLRSIYAQLNISYSKFLRQEFIGLEQICRIAAF